MIVKLRRGTENEYDQLNSILGLHEPAVTLDTGGMKVGDGVTPWRELKWTIEPSADMDVPDWMFEGLSVVQTAERRSLFRGIKFP